MNLTHEWKDNCSFFTDNETFIFSVDDPDKKFNENSIPFGDDLHNINICKYLLTEEQFSAHVKLDYESRKSILYKLEQQLDMIKLGIDELNTQFVNELFLRTCTKYKALRCCVNARHDHAKNILLNYGLVFLNKNPLIYIIILDNMFFNYFSYVKNDIDKMDYEICLFREQKSTTVYDNKRNRVDGDDNTTNATNATNTKKIKL